MSDPVPSDAAVKATALALHDIDYPAYPWRGPEFPGWADHFEPYLIRARAALAAGLAVEYTALADEIERTVEPNPLGDWSNGVLAAARMVRAAAGGTPVSGVTLGQIAAEQSAMIDASYPPGLDPEAHLWRRLSKGGEEHGETIEAMLGSVGENPRKGFTATHADIIKELLDEAFAALGAVEHLTGNEGRSESLLLAHATRVRDRLRAAIDSVGGTPNG